jgi:hypothetical protein
VSTQRSDIPSCFSNRLSLSLKTHRWNANNTQQTLPSIPSLLDDSSFPNSQPPPPSSVYNNNNKSNNINASNNLNTLSASTSMPKASGGATMQQQQQQQQLQQTQSAVDDVSIRTKISKEIPYYVVMYLN